MGAGPAGGGAQLGLAAGRAGLDPVPGLAGRSWRLGDTYLVVEESRAMSGRVHDRLAPGLNHLAFHAGPPDAVDRLVAAAPGHGWALLFPDRHPYAGGPDTYAAYLEDALGYEVELVAT